MLKRPRSKLGIFLSSAYVILCLFTVVALITSEPDGLSILAPMILTSPWSFLLFEVVGKLFEIIPESLAAFFGPFAFFGIFIVSAALNAAILYFVGWLFSVVGKAVNDLLDRRLAASKKDP